MSIAFFLFSRRLKFARMRERMFSAGSSDLKQFASANKDVIKLLGMPTGAVIGIVGMTYYLLDEHMQKGFAQAREQAREQELRLTVAQQQSREQAREQEQQAREQAREQEQRLTRLSERQEERHNELIKHLMADVRELRLSGQGDQKSSV